MNTPFIVNNQPFFVLGGQVHNSSGYGPESMETAWKALAALRANTADVPVYWEQVEPREGEFQFDHLEGIIHAARARGLKLVLLWFATWKNGSMQYAPQWVKNAPDRFPRVQTPGGTQTWVLSSHFPATWEADNRAFCRLLEFLKTVDSTDRTVISVQIENEPGILGSVRDYSPTAEAQFNDAVPPDLAGALDRLEDGPVGRAWRASGSPTAGTWPELFGPMAAEVFTTWSIARYIDRLAESGKAVYDLPMYANAWLGENGWQLPGVNYPSGGPVSFVLDLWKIASPHIDLLAPDIYLEPQADFNAICAAYARPDNPLFIPETGGNLSNALILFEAVARYGAVGYGVFGIESLLHPDGSLRPHAQPLVESFHILQAMLPLVTQFHGTGKLQAVIQREFMGGQLLDLGPYLGMVHFGSRGGWTFTDYNHHISPEETPRGRGLLVMPNPREIFLAGTGFRILLKSKQADERRLFAQASEHFDGPLTPYLRVEEGHFAPDGSWVVDRLRNGDEITSGLWAATDCGVIHALLVE
jgi:hypothetical protein